MDDDALLLSDLLRQLLRADWERRPTAAMALQHPLVQAVIEAEQEDGECAE